MEPENKIKKLSRSSQSHTKNNENPFVLKVQLASSSSKRNLKVCRKNVDKVAEQNDSEEHSQCVTCDRDFPTSDALEQHMRIHHAGKLFQCKVPYCGLKFLTMDEKTEHQLRDHKDTRKCQFCPRTYGINNRAEHMKKFHKSDNLVRCTYLKCTLYFRSEEEMQTHIGLEHADVEAQKCVLCGKYLLDINMRLHLRNSHKSQFADLFKCTFKCRKYFLTEAEREKHIDSAHERYSAREQEECIYCNKLYFGKRSLRMHIDNCHTERKIQCSVLGCAQYFLTETLLDAHFEQLHRKKEENKKYQCELCEYRTAYKGHLRSHMEHKHQTKNKRCPECKKMYRSHHALLNHLKTHDDINMCQYCNTAVPTLKRHQKLEKCTKCDQLLLCSKLATLHHKQCFFQ
jgi:KRAB domain-containing zinc finger protein